MFTLDMHEDNESKMRVKCLLPARHEQYDRVALE